MIGKRSAHNFRLAVLATALGALVLAGCDRDGGESVAAVEDPAGAVPELATEVTVVAAARGPIRSFLETSATIAARADVTILSKVTGRVERVDAEVGDVVEKGALLAKIEDREYRLAAERARIERDKAKSAFDRAKTLYGRELTSAQAFQDTEFVYRSAENAYQTAKLELEETEIRAPIAGRIVDRSVTAGAFISPQTPVARLIDFGSLEIALFIPEKDVARVREGQGVELTADSFPDLQLTYPIHRVDPTINPKTGTQRVLVKIPADAAVTDPRLRPGLFVQAKILTETRADALLVAKKALLVQGRNNRVYVVRGERIAEAPVRVGLSEGAIAEIVQGLEEGDVVVVDGQFGLRPDSLVTARVVALADAIAP